MENLATITEPQIDPADSAAAGKALRVLMADDSENDAALLLRSLRKACYEPAHCRVSGASAMRRLY